MAKGSAGFGGFGTDFSGLFGGAATNGLFGGSPSASGSVGGSPAGSGGGKASGHASAGGPAASASATGLGGLAEAIGGLFGGFGGASAGGSVGGPGGEGAVGSLGDAIGGLVGGLTGSGSLGQAVSEALGGSGGSKSNPGSSNSLGPSTYGPAWGKASTPSFRSAEDESMAAYYSGIPGPLGRAAEDQSMGKYNAYKSVFDTIGKAESKVHAYNSVVDEKKAFNLTDMTLQEVLDFQADRKAKGKNTAVGKYQTIASTLKSTIKSLDLDPNKTKFTPAIQDYIAMDLIDKRAARAAKSKEGLTPESLAKEMAKEWAGLATPTGKSYYAGVGKNAANVSYAETLAAAKSLYDSGAVGGGTGKTPQSIGSPSTTAVASNETSVPSVSPASGSYGYPGGIVGGSIGGSVSQAPSVASATPSQAGPAPAPSSPSFRSAENQSMASLDAIPAAALDYMTSWGFNPDVSIAGYDISPPGMEQPGAQVAGVPSLSGSFGGSVGGGAGTGIGGSVSGSPAAPGVSVASAGAPATAPSTSPTGGQTTAPSVGVGPSQATSGQNTPTAQDVMAGYSDYGVGSDGSLVIKNDDGTISVVSAKTGLIETYTPDGKLVSIEPMSEPVKQAMAQGSDYQDSGQRIV